ncbi:MAG: hypothetical protein EOS46_27820 [Mesorhizobium sp.]|uniref:hypothetical protein n=1 Tax=Mesorhizobium sp. TaxID=1871066 RepID=UPI000FE6C79B|nr:hypothetical protein [Mesorhizobium sp.]RWF41604.1 MAG: hypothetical protein EOS46_27820 [Mesorhizobium sp.]
MTWFAIRTLPGAQRPQREFSVESTRDPDAKGRGKGYRIVPNINQNMSAIERALSDAGIICYMPSERRLVRDRLKPYLWKTHRFAMLVGYVFVRDPNWDKLHDIAGIAGVVSINGEPLPVDFFDILKVWDAETSGLEGFNEDVRKARQSLRKLAKRDPAIRKIVDSLDIAGTISVPLQKLGRAA